MLPDDSNAVSRGSVDPESGQYGRRPLTVRGIINLVVVLQATLLALYAVDRFVGIEIPYFRPIVAVVLLTFGPGLLLLSLLDVRDQRPLSALLYAAGLSLVLTMMVGVGISLLYPTLGIARPIAELSILATFAGVNLSLVILVMLVRDTRTVITTLPSEVPSAPVMFFLSLPFLAVIAITTLNRYGMQTVPIALLTGLSLVPLFAVTRYVNPRLYPLVVWTSALSLLYYKSFWSGSYPIEMWMHQMVIEQGQWVPTIGGDLAALPDIRGIGQEGVLVDAVLYPVYAYMADVKMMVQLEVVNPLFVSLIPLGMYETFRRYVNNADAMLATFVFVFMYRFYAQHYPNAPRDVMATLFLVLIALLIADSHIRQHTARVLALVFAAGITVSHYGAAYLSIGAFSFAFIGVVAFVVWEYRLWRPPRNLSARPVRSAIKIVDPVFIGFLIAFVLAWYLYTGGGLKFMIVVQTIADITSITEVSGLASERVLSEKPPSVEWTRKFIILGFGLVSLGAATDALRRVLTGQSIVDPEYMSLAAGTVGVFGMTFSGIGTGFGQGRILMLSLSLTSLFILIAPYSLRKVGHVLARQYETVRWVHERTTKRLTLTRVRTFFGVCLCAFLLINTGVVAETVTGGQDYGSSIILNNERLANSEDPALRAMSKGCIKCDIQTHVWTLNHGIDGASVYDGGLSKNYYWYGHSVVAQVDGFVTDYLLTNRSTLYQNELPAEWSSVEEGSYVLLTEDNYDSGWVFTSEEEPISIRRTEASLHTSDRVYTTGRSTVYRFPSLNTTATATT